LQRRWPEKNKLSSKEKHNLGPPLLIHQKRRYQRAVAQKNHQEIQNKNKLKTNNKHPNASLLSQTSAKKIHYRRLQYTHYARRVGNG
jgi:hypothetical protein